MAVVAGVVLSGLLSLAAGCSDRDPSALVCRATGPNNSKQSWVLRINEAERSAEMVVHVPSDSIARGTPVGSRSGSVLVSERAYDVTIPSDSGGQGDQAWVRLQFQFEIDRYTGQGTLWIGEERTGERSRTPLSCEAVPGSPRI